MDPEEQYILGQLMDGYTPSKRGRAASRIGRRRPEPRPASSPTPAVPELLDEYELVFFHNGATLHYVESVSEPWRKTGLSAREVRDWLDAGVYDDEPDVAQALATAGFEPRQAARIRGRYGPGEAMNLISWVRGASDKAVRAMQLMDLVIAARSKAERETG